MNISSRPALTVAVFFVLLISVSAQGQNLVSLETAELPALPEALVDPLIGVVDGDPVVMGGWKVFADSSSWAGSAYLFSAGSWKLLEDVSGIARPEAATAVVGDDFLVIGGRSDTAWTTEVTQVSNGLDYSIEQKPSLPVPLAQPVATSAGQNVAVAGWVGSGDESKIRVFQIDFLSLDPNWTELPPVMVETGERLSLALQDAGYNLTSNAADGSSFSMHRYTAQTGWVEKSGPGEPLDVRGAVPLGQAHVAYVSPRRSGEHVVWSYSVIADTWAEMGRLELAGGRLKAKPVGEALLTAESIAEGSSTQLAITEFEVGKRHFYWLDFAAVIVYLACMILIGVYFSRREAGTEDFFVGGRKMPWWAVGFSLYATGTSAISFMAIPAKSYATNWLYFAQNIVGFVAIIPVALLIVPLIRRLNLTTTYEYLEMRFHTVIRLMGSILNMTYQLGARMSVVLFLPALALSAVTGVDVVSSIVFMGLIATIYTVLGGIKAVIWTDVAQVVVLLGGAFLCLVVVILGIDGGLGELMSVTAADNKMHTFDWRFDLTLPTMWLFLILATADMITWPRDQVMVQRVLSTKTAKEAGFSVWTLMAIVAPGSLLFFSLGTALYGFYKVHPERLSPLLNLDATLPFFIAAELPAGIAGLIIAALFAASMSTLDSSMNSVATLIVVDFYQRFKKGVTDHRALIVAKWITVATGVFGTLLALLLTRYSLPSLWDTFIMLTGLLGGGFGGVYALGMFTRRTNWQGAMVGIIASIVVTLAARAYTDIHVLLYVGVAVFTCIIVGYLVSFLFPAPDNELTGLTVYRQDRTKKAPANVDA